MSSPSRQRATQLVFSSLQVANISFNLEAFSEQRFLFFHSFEKKKYKSKGQFNTTITFPPSSKRTHKDSHHRYHRSLLFQISLIFSCLRFTFHPLCRCFFLFRGASNSLHVDFYLTFCHIEGYEVRASKRNLIVININNNKNIKGLGGKVREKNA